VTADKPRRITFGQALRTPFLARLAEAGWSRDSLTTVICTHLHADHVGWNTLREEGQWVPTFPRARYLLGRTEYDCWTRARDAEQEAVWDDSIQPLFDANLVELVEMDRRLSPEIRLLFQSGSSIGGK
jgi:glyoxylase-like metal-dependent hydrolase (beta-lactamase superfamily II)